MSTDCVFCRIVAGAERAAVVRSDERTVAFLPVEPATRGHVLVISKRHARNIFDIDAADLGAVSLAAKEVALWQRERLDCEGVSLFQSNEPAGFQTVFHYHVHVVPRYSGDRIAHAWTNVPRASIDELERVARKLRGGADAAPTLDGPGRPTHALGAASVILDDRRRVLLVHHNYGRHNWEIPGGISEAGESAEMTARREAREELGVEIIIEALTGVYWEAAWRGHGGHHFVFRARLTNGAPPRAADPQEIADFGWFSFDGLPRPISDFTMERIRHALEGSVPLVHTVGPRRWSE